MHKPIYYEYRRTWDKSKIVSLKHYSISIILIIILITSLFSFKFVPNIFSSVFSNYLLSPLADEKIGYEVFGFAPYWTFHKLGGVDFDVLTTFAYFGIDVNGDGELDKEGQGYRVFQSTKATEIFNLAHSKGVRVVLTITQMDNDNIKSLLDSPNSQKKAIKDTVQIVKQRGIDGVNVDFEYVGNPGKVYKKKFTKFVTDLSKKMHEEIPSSKVTVSVYASSAIHPKLYDIASLSKNSDGIFMMAYDFATAGSETVIPTSPLNGHKEGKYWYDVSTAVDDFLKVMDPKKLILGLPWYGYDYPVSEPQIKAPKDYGYYTYYWWKGYRYSRFIGREGASAQTYANAKDFLPKEIEGWDNVGKVGWRAYRDTSGLWRMIFLDDERSLDIKYEFAKGKKLAGIGIWALGFDHGKEELWTLLRHKFGTKLAKI